MLKKIFLSLLSGYRSFRRFWLKINNKTENDIHEQRVVSGKSWEEFCDTLKAAGTALVFNGTPQDSFSQAEGYRYLSRLTRAGLEAFIEYADPAYPVLRRMVHETVKLGADNPDNYYQNAQISGEYEYRITGNRKTAHYLGFAVQRGTYGKGEGMKPAGMLEAADMNINTDGSFEIIISQEKKGQNWLESTPDTSLLIVRQTFLDAETEELAEMKIERIGDDVQPRPVSPQVIDEGLNTAGLFVAGAPLLFAKWANGFKKYPNQLPLFDPETSTNAGGDPQIAYYHGYWKLEKDEALVITAKPPKCEYWNFQLNNYWMESLDYRQYRIHINAHTAKYEDDGSVKVIVAHEDPGHPNWIQTVGHMEGTMCWRWVKADDWANPQTEVIQLAQ
ncbi:MAG: DUF1214 domain-containing protein [Cyclobacteriaceae bacterium]